MTSKPPDWRVDVDGGRAAQHLQRRRHEQHDAERREQPPVRPVAASAYEPAVRSAACQPAARGVRSQQAHDAAEAAVASSTVTPTMLTTPATTSMPKPVS